MKIFEMLSFRRDGLSLIPSEMSTLLHKYDTLCLLCDMLDG